jgi:hypothetical protein
MIPGFFQYLLRACFYIASFQKRLGFNGFIAVDFQVDYRAVNINPKLYAALRSPFLPLIFTAPFWSVSCCLKSVTIKRIRR